MDNKLEPCWRKSSYSGNGGTSCVEVASTASDVRIRDTKANGTGPVLVVAPDVWRSLVMLLKAE